MRLDPRTHAVRRDIADVALAGRVFAPHYARPLDHGCLVANVAIRIAPSIDATAVSELLRGECFCVVDASGSWAWGFSEHDHYVGYVPIDTIGATEPPTHIVAVPAALIFADADIKSTVTERLPMGVRLAAMPAEGNFFAVAGGFVHQRHVAPIDAPAADAVEVASRLIGTPYRWGGRSGDGIDCSGLVQLALGFCGIDAPRDSDQQQALGEAITESDAVQRGDLIFLPGHVGFMADAGTLLHANAFHMRVTQEPLADVLARQPEGKGVIARRRIAA